MLVKICINGHQYKANNNKLKCGKCGEPLNFQKKPEKKKPEITIEDMNFNQLIDHLSRIPWFNEIQNNEDVLNSRKRWKDDELEMIQDFFEEYGIASAEVWKEIAEGVFQRSLYSIEHVLRFFYQGYNLNDFR